MNTSAFWNLSYGVYVISTWDSGRPTGCVANSAMQITSSPATIAVSMNHDNYTNQCIQESGHFSVSILAEDSDPSIIGTFGFQSGKNIDKFANVPYEVRGFLPVVSDACSYITCKVIDKMETSTHTVFLGEVIDADLLKPGAPMTYSYYHKVVKGKSPKNAPTYLPDEAIPASNEKETWACSICGYVYEGETPFEELPEDYTCPLCMQPKSVFVKQ